MSVFFQVLAALICFFVFMPIAFWLSVVVIAVVVHYARKGIARLKELV